MVLNKPPGQFRDCKDAVKMTCVWLVCLLCIITPPAVAWLLVWLANR